MDLTESEQKNLYTSLLRGLARTAQDQLCAADKQHDWSPWHRTALQRDVPIRPGNLSEAVYNETIQIRADRHCLNCGKAQVE
jgi:hypothetical protein